MIDPVEFGKTMGGIVREAVAPLLKRIEELEARKLERGEDGKSVTVDDVAPLIADQVKSAVASLPAPKDGTSVTLDDVAPMIADRVKAEVSALPPAAKGDPGADGRSVTAEDIAPMIAEQVKSAVDTIPKPKDGEPGKDADPIPLADVIAELAIAPEVKTVLSLLVAEAVQEGVSKALPAAVEAHLKANPPKDGRDGTNGADGRAGVDGKDGERGEKGADGIGLAGAIIDRDGALVVTMTDGTTKSLGPVVGKDGQPGKDGLSLTDVSRVYDADAHEVVEKWTVADVTKELRYPVGGIRPGGFWKEGEKTRALQTKTHNGSAWVALRDTAAEPSVKNPQDWHLFVRQGAPGRDLRDAKPPEPVKLGSQTKTAP